MKILPISEIKTCRTFFDTDTYKFIHEYIPLFKIQGQGQRVKVTDQKVTDLNQINQTNQINQMKKNAAKEPNESNV